MKLALFKNIEFQHSSPAPCGEIFERVANYVRISEYVEIEFPPLASEEMIGQQLAALDQAESAVRLKFESALNAIKERRSELLALPHHAAVDA